MPSVTTSNGNIRLATNNGSRKSRNYRVRSGDPYQELFCRLQSVGFVGGGLRTIGFTSCTRHEGVTTIASNLAVYAAETTTEQVLVVDANLAHPALHKSFRLRPTPGLVDLITRKLPLEEVIQPSRLTNLSILPAGVKKEPPRTNFRPDEVWRVFEALCMHFDLIVVDLPAVSIATTLGSLASKLDGIALVLEAEGVSSEAAQRTLRQLEDEGTSLLGAVFNKRRKNLPRWLDRNFGT